MRKKVQLHNFFILYDNVNFYKLVQNTYIFNHIKQVNYSAKYIYFMNFSYFSGLSKDNFLNLKNFIYK